MTLTPRVCYVPVSWRYSKNTVLSQNLFLALSSSFSFMLFLDFWLFYSLPTTLSPSFSLYLPPSLSLSLSLSHTHTHTQTHTLNHLSLTHPQSSITLMRHSIIRFHDNKVLLKLILQEVLHNYNSRKVIYH